MYPTTSLTADDRARERRVRTLARRQEMRLMKSRRRNPEAVDYGRFWLVNDWNNGMVLGDRHGASLDEVEEWLLSMPST